MDDCILSPGFNPGRALSEHFHAQSSMLMHPEAAFVRSTCTTPATNKKVEYYIIVHMMSWIILYNVTLILVLLQLSIYHTYPLVN